MSTQYYPHLIILMLLYIKTASDSDFFLSCLSKYLLVETLNMTYHNNVRRYITARYSKIQ